MIDKNGVIKAWDLVAIVAIIGLALFLLGAIIYGAQQIWNHACIGGFVLKFIQEVL